ncbi:acyl-CoA carboxylase subunit epsilon [Speluncibacter jeojiensis]|uniref:Acyl-CoA carboxylase subunit epsilon n=1 Tax=Speluncibacter jeojiensis TaxID=2710754 RepID=A0A9X4LXC9_9ACTN|nr:acyl-CoA carboxylase subunit epsilon [Corynebacteriales bacterium D3-21]
MSTEAVMDCETVSIDELVDEVGVVDDMVAAVTEAAQAEDARTIKIVKGNPSDEEIAALVVVLAAAGSADDGGDDSGKPRELWGDFSEALDRTVPGSPLSYQNDRRWGR